MDNIKKRLLHEKRHLLHDVWYAIQIYHISKSMDWIMDIGHAFNSYQKTVFLYYDYKRFLKKAKNILSSEIEFHKKPYSGVSIIQHNKRVIF